MDVTAISRQQFRKYSEADHSLWMLSLTMNKLVFILPKRSHRFNTNSDDQQCTERIVVVCHVHHHFIRVGIT